MNEHTWRKVDVIAHIEFLRRNTMAQHPNIIQSKVTRICSSILPREFVRNTECDSIKVYNLSDEMLLTLYMSYSQSFDFAIEYHLKISLIH